MQKRRVFYSLEQRTVEKDQKPSNSVSSVFIGQDQVNLTSDDVRFRSIF
jgi:hypothetical protein